MKNITVYFNEWTDEDINLSVGELYYTNELTNSNDLEEILRDPKNIDFMGDIKLFENIVSTFNSDELKIEYDVSRQNFKVTFNPFICINKSLPRAIMECYLSFHLEELYLI